MTPASIVRFLKALYREAGISNASSHSGRRTLITRLAERGVDLKAIAEIAGHASIRTTAVYVEVQPAATRPHPAGRDVVSEAEFHSLVGVGMPLARAPDRGPGEHSGAVRDRGPASALARRLPARDEGWQKAYYGENRPKVLRFIG
jgi:hypothetical protein